MADELKAEHWRGVVAEQEASGLSVAAFCRERTIPAWKFHYWRKRLREVVLSGRVRDMLLDVEDFTTYLEALVIGEQWRQHCYTKGPQALLGSLTPGPFAASVTMPNERTEGKAITALLSPRSNDETNCNRRTLIAGGT